MFLIKGASIQREQNVLRGAQNGFLTQVQSAEGIKSRERESGGSIRVLVDLREEWPSQRGHSSPGSCRSLSNTEQGD